MNKEIRLIYLDFKLIIMEIEDSKEIYKAALLYITSNNRKYDKMLSKLWHILVKKICHNFIVPNFHI